jgi:hypothetical protein
MAQSLQTGHTFGNTDLVTGDLMNQMVNNALVLPGIIDGQDAVGSVATTDALLISSSGVLKKATVSQLSAGLQLNAFVKTDGTIPMQSGAQLQLGTSTPVGNLDAVSKGALTNTLGGYLVNTVPSGYYAPFNGILGIYGGGLILFAGNPLVLGQDPVNPLEAATKQYVDSASTIKARVSFSGELPDATTVPSTYSRLVGSQDMTINTGFTPHGLKAGHRLFINFTSGTVADGSFIVSTVIDQYKFTVNTTLSTPINGNCQFVKALIRSAYNVDSIIFGTAGNDGGYFLNFTNNFPDTNYAPLLSCSFIANESTNARANGHTAFWDDLRNVPQQRSVNSITFSTYTYGAFTPTGTRSSIVVF